MIYIPKYFKPYELVSPDFYEKWGDISIQWIDAGLLHDLDIIREYINLTYECSIIINDWKWNGSYKDSGLRTSLSKHYSPTSPHSFGKAVDIKLSKWVKGDLSILTNQIIDDIIKLKNDNQLKYITRIELDTNLWVHIDTFNRQPNNNNLFTFKP